MCNRNSHIWRITGIFLEQIKVKLFIKFADKASKYETEIEWNASVNTFIYHLTLFTHSYLLPLLHPPLTFTIPFIYKVFQNLQLQSLHTPWLF